MKLYDVDWNENSVKCYEDKQGIYFWNYDTVS